MDTGGPAVKPESKRKLKSAARPKEFQQSKRLAKLRGTLLRAMKRVRFDRMWRVHNEWYAARAISARACDSRVGEATPMEAEPVGATRAEASAVQRSAAASSSKPTLQEASSADFVPGLQWVEVEGAWHSAAVTWDAGLATAEPSVAADYGRCVARPGRRMTDDAEPALSLQLLLHHQAPLHPQPHHAGH